MLWLAVAMGGSIGALARYGLASWFYVHPVKFPLTTFIANILGSLLMGVCYVVIVEKGLLPAVWRQFVMIGFLGAFTTFSTFSIESLHLILNGHWQLSIFYAVSSVLGSLIAVYAGIKLVENFI